MTIRPIKSLGQSFLIHEPTADALIAALELKPDDTVIEIGPGKGILTKRLIRACNNVIAVEIDYRLVCYLEAEIGESPNLKIVHQDFLKFDLNKFNDAKIIGNLPYNISSPIIFRLLDNISYWQRAVLTAQREFAEKVLLPAGTKGSGVLTVLCEYLCTRRRLFNIPPRFFKPSPKVISTAFTLMKRPSPAVAISHPEFFYKLINAAFTPQPRKRLINNIALNLGINKEILKNIFVQLNLPLDARAKDLTLNQFALIADVLFPYSQ
ncbi:MAG: 16S rRNA (adenine(1518)-N(6)/adenine(1519)-N(6))-dimethyltransferase RsmA [candidate division WOR-3 bacterium]